MCGSAARFQAYIELVNCHDERENEEYSGHEANVQNPR